MIQVLDLNRPHIHEFSNRVYSVDGVARTLMGSGGNNNDKAGQYVVVKTNNSKGYDIAEEEEDTINFEQPTSTTRRGRVGHGVAQTLTTSCNQGVFQGLNIRRLTPKECFRLQGFDDSDVDILIQNKISDTQLYKMAGNSITVDVLEELFCMLFDVDGEFYL